jgi:hypothetical protein
MVKKKHVFRLPVEKPKGKRTFGRLILTLISKKGNGLA